MTAEMAPLTQARRHWQTPQLRTDEEEERERKTSWLELFYDLVFVAVVAELSHALAGDLTPGGVLRFVLLFVPAWWIWIGGTFYTDRFETDDVSHRLFTFLQMLAVAGLAYNVHDGMGASSRGFALSYVAGRLIIIYLWLRGGYHSPAARPMTNRYNAGFALSVLLWLVSLAVPPPWRFVLWGLGLAIDLVTPITTFEIQRRLPRLSSSHLPERFGLFTLIVLGESVIAVVGGTSARHDLDPLTMLAGALGLALAFGFWWIYFDQVAGRRRRANPWAFMGWAYTHMALLMALTATGAGILNLLSFEGTGGTGGAPLPTGVRWLVCGAVAATLLALGVIELATMSDEPAREPRQRTVRFGAAAAALLLGALGGVLHPVALLGLLLLLCAGQVVLGLLGWGVPGTARATEQAEAAEATEPV